MEDVHKAMQQKLGKQLDVMRSEIVKDFPDEEPEILLLQWICDRYGIKRPKHKPKVHIEHELFEDQTVKISRMVRLPSMEWKGQVADAELAEVKYRSPRPSPKVQMTTESMLLEKLNTQHDSSAIASSNKAGHCVEDDAWRYQESMECLQTGQDRLQGTVAKLRTQLRGKFISRIPLLCARVLTDMDRHWLVGKLRPWNFDAGEVIVEQGNVGDKLYIIERGNCEVIVNGKVVDVIGRENFFGELSVMYVTPRTATVRAKTEVTLLSLSRADLLSTIDEDKVAELAMVARARLFKGVPLLSALSPKRKEFVTACLKQQTWEDGVVLARQGHLTLGDNRRMYIILDGECRQEVKPSSFHNEEAGVEVIRHGQFFNMFAMWYEAPCAATVTTIGKVTTLSISYDELNAICTEEVCQSCYCSEKSEAFSDQPSLRNFGAQPSFRHNKTTKFKHLEQAEPETMKSIRYAMWIHLFKLLFLKVGMEDIAYNSNALELVCEQAVEVTFKTWDPVFTKGVAYDTVYILQVGALSEHEDDIETLRDQDELNRGKCIHHNAPGACFGMMSLQGKGKSVPTTTATASQETLMLCIQGDVLRRMLRNGSLV